MGKKILLFIGYVLMASAFYNGILAYVNKNLTSQIPDIELGMGEYPMWHLLGVHAVLFLVGLTVVIIARRKKNENK
ncbi:MAG: hypothetical protein RBS89_01255 [Candidatus Delongbacteria bacterium]|jgi:hypothetical protein|nr:hypothetical protein [Candidatus Delongbacteria bacterium]